MKRHPLSLRPLLEAVEGRLLLAKVALFFNGSYVDTGTNPVTATAVNLRDQLAFGGANTVTTFTGIDATSVGNALANADVLVMPTLAKGSLVSSMTNVAKNAIRSFLRNGGGLIMAGNWSVGSQTGRNADFLSDVFNYGNLLAENAGSPYSLNASGAAGTAFANGPATIGLNPGYGGYLNDLLPAGSKIIYQYTSFNANTAVALLPYAGGLPIVTLGWDWTNGGPNGSLDSGWNTVLNDAVKQVAKKRVPAVPSLLTAQATSASAATLSWKDNSADESGFSVERSTSASGPWTVLTTSAANAVSYTASGLSQGTNYFFRVRAVNSVGFSVYAPVASTTTDFNPFAVLVGSALTVNGTVRNDRITLSQSGTTLTVKLNSASKTFSTTAITSIKVLAGAGDDTVTIGPGVRGTRVEGGAGNDTLAGGANADSLFGLAGNDVLIGNGGADSLDGGDGNDQFFAVDSVKDIINGGGGTDVLYGDANDTKSLVEDVVV